MFQNIKVDIIYYKSNTDFELEFNLCGCCRMRLLTDKASDRRNLVHHLARAVSRSRVIIIAGALFGEDGIINIVSNSISKSLTTINNEYYGIVGDDSISIIEGATPLVSPDGYFGGCIIESGPQSMILLSENKTIRKSIMKTLIHPYVEELCAIDLKQKAAAAHNTSVSNQEPLTAADINSLADEKEIHAQPIAEENNEIVTDYNENSSTESDISGDNAGSARNDIIDENDNKDDNAPDKVLSDNMTDGFIEMSNVNSNDGKSAEEKQPNEKTTDIDTSQGMIFESQNSSVENIPDMNFDISSSSQSENTCIENEDIPLNNMKIQHSEESNNSNDKLENQDKPFCCNTNEKRLISSSSDLPILIISILLLIIIAILCYCIFYIPSKEGISASTYLQQTFSTLFGPY